MSWWNTLIATARITVRMRNSLASTPTPESFSSGERPTMPAMVAGMPRVLFFTFIELTNKRNFLIPSPLLADKVTVFKSIGLILLDV